MSQPLERKPLSCLIDGPTPMHRTTEITVPATGRGALVFELRKLDCLISLAVHRGPSIKPSGDVLVLHTLELKGRSGVAIANA